MCYRYAVCMDDKPGKKLYLVNVRVDYETREAIKAFAEAENRSVSNYIATLLREHVAERQNRDATK